MVIQFLGYIVVLVLQRFLLDVMKLLDQVHYFHGVLQAVDYNKSFWLWLHYCLYMYLVSISVSLTVDDLCIPKSVSGLLYLLLVALYHVFLNL